MPDSQHKKSMFPYVEPTVETAEEINKKQEIIDTDFVDLQYKFNKVNDVAREQKKQRDIEVTFEDVIDQDNPFSTFKNFWWEEDMFDNRGSTQMVDESKNILHKVNKIFDNLLKNLWPIENTTEQELADDQNIPIEDRTQQELEDYDFLSVESDVEEIDTTSVWDKKNTTIKKPRPVLKLSIDYNRKVKVANKIKNKYQKKIIGQRNKSNKISAEWLKTAGYLDTKDQDQINYIFLPLKKETTNKIPDDAAHFIRTEIVSTNFKKESLTSKIRKDETKKPYFYKEKTEEGQKDSETTETIKILDNIANLEPWKNAQLAAKKINEKYKRVRETLAKKWKYKITGETVKIKEVETQQGKVKVPVSVEKSSKKVIEKYDQIRHENKFKKIVDANKKRKKNRKNWCHQRNKNFFHQKECTGNS